jgi:Ca-activated chloride channel family protein
MLLSARLPLLAGLSPESLTGWGTNLEALLDAASAAFVEGFPTRREILLVSDGEEISGSLEAAVQRAASRGIGISVLALGTKEGGPLPEGGPIPEGGALHGLHRAGLSEAALGGVYAEAGMEGDLIRRFASLGSGASEGGGASLWERQEEVDRRHWFVLIALAALALSKKAEKRLDLAGRRRSAPEGNHAP